MNRSAPISRNTQTATAEAIGERIHVAMRRGLAIGQAVKIGTVRGIVIGYNISRAGRFPGDEYPLLVKTELGIAKFGLEEVQAA